MVSIHFGANEQMQQNKVEVWLNTVYNLATQEVHYADCSNERLEKYGRN